MLAFAISSLIFFITFWLILSEKIHKTIVALYWAVIMVLFWYYYGFYSFADVLEAIDFNTIVLLFSMMIIVSVLEKTWLFQYLAIKTAKNTRGNFWLLIIYLASLSAILSTFLPNLTTIMIIAPVTIIIAQMLSFSPVPFLIAEVIFSNIWWVSTLVWAPPNMIIASVAWYDFNYFFFHSFPVVVCVFFWVLFLLRLLFNKEIKEHSHVKNLKDLLSIKEEKSLQHRKRLKKTLIILWLLIVSFFIQPYLWIPLAFIALFFAALLLLIVQPKDDPEPILEHLELSVLLFFIALFVLVWWIEKAWVLDFLAGEIMKWVQDNIVITALFILWICAILSSILDNIPLTIAMVPIISYLWEHWVQDIDLLWWAIIFGIWLGWNGLWVWSTAWVLVLSKAEWAGYPITSVYWLKTAWLSMLFSVIIASILLIIFWKIFFVS